MYELKGKDLYSQSGEGLILEYVWHSLHLFDTKKVIFDIGCGDRFILSNSRHLKNSCGFYVCGFDVINDRKVDLTNCTELMDLIHPCIISIDIDGYDYWILDKILPFYKPEIVIAEFNASYTDSRTIKYNPDHVWAGDSYYGFTFEAGKKLAEKHGYKVIFQIANMNMLMVRADLVEGLEIPPVTYQQSDYFKMSEREDWIFI